jgi:hypothetical protein
MTYEVKNERSQLRIPVITMSPVAWLSPIFNMISMTKDYIHAVANSDMEKTLMLIVFYTEISLMWHEF